MARSPRVRGCRARSVRGRRRRDSIACLTKEGQKMTRPAFITMLAAATLAALVRLPAQAEERFSPLRLDALSSEQQEMQKMLVTPPRNSRINTGPFNAFA